MNLIISVGGISKIFLDDDYNLPKPLIKSLGKPIIFWNIDEIRGNDLQNYYENLI